MTAPRRVFAVFLVIALYPGCSLSGGARVLTAQDGPTAPIWSGGASATSGPVGESGVVTYGHFFLINNRRDSVELVSISPIGLRGLSVISIAVHAAKGNLIGVSERYPAYPPAELHPVRGARIAPRSGRSSVQIVVGLRLQEGVEIGHLDAFSVEYRIGGQNYRMRSAQKVTLRGAGVSSSK